MQSEVIIEAQVGMTPSWREQMRCSSDPQIVTRRMREVASRQNVERVRAIDSISRRVVDIL